MHRKAEGKRWRIGKQGSIFVPLASQKTDQVEGNLQSRRQARELLEGHGPRCRTRSGFSEPVGPPEGQQIFIFEKYQCKLEKVLAQGMFLEKLEKNNESLNFNVFEF